MRLAAGHPMLFRDPCPCPLWAKVDMTALSPDVRYTPNSGHESEVLNVRFVP